jgi:hypothetical protein
MTDTITLPRAVVEMAAERLREAIGVYAECPEDIAALNALEAALDAALAEPEKGNCADGSCNCCWTDKPDAKREPAPEKQVYEQFYNDGRNLNFRLTDYRLGWEAAERFHGITKEDK